MKADGVFAIGSIGASIVIIGASFFITGCWKLPDVALVGTEKGIRAYNDGIAGIQKQAMDPAGSDSKYFANRQHQETNETTRANHPGFLDGLFAKQGE